MKDLKTGFIGLISILNSTIFLNAQTSDLDVVKSEIKVAAMKEQNAFKNGDCAQVLDLMESNITFLANGNIVPSQDMIEKFCKSIPRPFKEPLVDTMEIYPLTKDTGYVVRFLEYMKDDKTKMQEYVTKIWRKTDDKWLISHLHSTIKKVAISD
ncbi:MAG: nuclear transport factor 2 family protein [Aquaticitalea sp.]